jgi:hypothetical protein
VDNVLPVAPFRQWTVSLPWEVRGLLAFRPDVLNDVSRAVTRTLNHGQGDRLPDDKTHAAGISVLHRFGSSLQIHPHIHSLVADGVYVHNDGAVYLRGAHARGDLRPAACRLTRRGQGGLMRTAVARPASINGVPNTSPSPPVQPLDDVVVTGKDGTVGTPGRTTTGCNWEVLEKRARRGG